MRFVKMHGLGNDYVFVDAFRQERIKDPAALARRISARHTGVCSDGLILIEPDAGGADASMRIFNADGSEAQTCGNGLRCVGKYLYDEGLVRKRALSVRTRAGLNALLLEIEGARVSAVCVDMGPPILQAARIPLAPDDARVHLAGPAPEVLLEVPGGPMRFSCLSMGNPHAVHFGPPLPDALFAAIGPLVERSEVFPERTNVEFVTVCSPQKLSVRVWERGSGETRACGSGACASLVAAALGGLSERAAAVHLPGGALWIEWRPQDDHVLMTGPAETVFVGEWPA